MGMSKPVHVLARNTEVEEIVNVAALAVVDAQENEVIPWLKERKHVELVGE
jgi:hypothetical protein